MEPGYYVVGDCDQRTNTVVYFDAINWWFPGSEKPWKTSDFEGHGRFQIKHKISVEPHAYGEYKVYFCR